MTKTPERMKKIQDVISHRQRDMCIVLEDVHDPHNAAAVLRSCDAFGIQNVHFIFQNMPPYDPARIGKQSSSNANKWLTFHIHESTEDCYKALHAQGFTLFATALHAESEPLHSCNFTQKPVALIFGNEHAGLTPYAIGNADVLVHIPMQGMVESLNISVCAAVCMYEVTRQRRDSGLDFGLRPEDSQALLKDFAER